MVHLTTVPDDHELETPIVKGLEKIKLEHFPEEEEESVSATVYGSRFAGQEMPKSSMCGSQYPRTYITVADPCQAG